MSCWGPGAVSLMRSAPGLKRWVAAISCAHTNSATALIALVLLSAPAFSQPHPITATIDASRRTRPSPRTFTDSFSSTAATS